MPQIIIQISPEMDKRINSIAPENELTKADMIIMLVEIGLERYSINRKRR